MTGAHITLMEYVIPIQLKKPIVDNDTPTSRSHADNVEKTSKNGNPAENPRNTMPITRGRV